MSKIDKNNCTFFTINDFTSEDFATPGEAYEAAKVIMQGDEMKTNWEDVIFIETINGNEDAYQY